jgi:preprotein translocase subunit SecA
MQGPGQSAPGTRNGNGNGAGRGVSGTTRLARGGVTGTAGTAALSGARRPGGSNPVQAGADGGQARPGYTPSGAKIGRNDACWCGSGLKYKKCHGR